MEEDSRTSPEPAYHVDGTDTEYISGLSTLLAATIQETKESVSQIEYLFCKQLFPDFQSKLKKVYSEAKKAAEEECKKKENDLIDQLKTLQSEKQNFLEENQFLKMENSKVKKVSGSSSKHGNDLEEELKRKNKEIAEKRELQQSLRELLDSKASLVHGNEKRLKELEDENHLLREKTNGQEIELEELRLTLRCKSRIIEEKEESNCELLELVQSKVFLIEQKERQLKEVNDKKNELLAKLGISEKKIDEKIECEETLLTKTRTQASEIVKTRKLLDDCENVKRLLIAKVKGLEEEIDKLQMDVRERSNESTEGMELHGKLLQQIEGKNAEIMIEKQKRREVVDAYKKLKSQYIYLCSKSGLTPENMIGNTSKEVNKDSLGHDQNILNSPVNGQKSPNIPVPVCETTNHTTNQQNSEVKKEIKSTSNDITKKSNLLSGTKRPLSHWRDTRPTKNRNGPDPHDDFLDTPLENIKQDLKKVSKGKEEEEIHHLPDPVPKDMNFESSDDETQDPSGRPEKKNFKYVEPVRKKADRANLKGIECKQCKKFYDAVLPEGSDGNNNSKQNLRCEHHEGVSRHRFRFAPPSTPEGFWNIGFESEM
ncbi:unnamed protein product [Lactuca virosa]|uniref:DNA endonuclease activator Ctp1 C-terminal domain-containing protein n=1 Tax=Lactuca virosa TaxID=75947 RepID=A0AAU9LQ34_9ASTR|nr:unnamed protein product [Lactuca virosa]